ncbi:winged helix DNA-binding domain-containing protein [Amycolatopsis alkalitolerans]|uniref:Winged helix DNA-binding domain-containing protein n=1 Tax=Amycolatopsis alkalitolerans TaxID=2547244 RepID=A0A5C4LRV1_9PSEU|nr:winged helix DNA-binding domain-containing protein [Amycolatopsis alkalitolerans]TNC20876.1 winged helix DNA-binding domain-containing protein [Amycolatopsis alkalitolerans]
MESLSPRALNRALLARQFLLRRVKLPPLEAVRRLCGMQAQAPFPPYFGLWSRLHGFAPEDLSRLLLDRTVVRVVLMRGTVHLVTAEDCLFLRPLVQPILDRDLRTNTTYAPALAGLDLPALAEHTRAVLAERARTGAELGELLAKRHPGRSPSALAHAARGLLPLVQTPPRAVWGHTGKPTYATAEQWLGRPLDKRANLDDLVLRYLAAFGPATVPDIQAWSGLSRLGEVIDRLRPRLKTFADAGGRELVDLPEAPRPDPDTPAPPRFVPEFDNLLLSHADRTRVLSEEARKRVFGVPNGVFPGTVLVDGFVRGTWRITKTRAAATLDIEPYQRISKKDSAALASAGARLLRFAAPGRTPDVRWHEPR